MTKEIFFSEFAEQGAKRLLSDKSKRTSLISYIEFYGKNNNLPNSRPCKGFPHSEIYVAKLPSPPIEIRILYEFKKDRCLIHAIGEA